MTKCILNCLKISKSLQDPNMKMCTLVVYPGPSSFPRIMSLKVVFQICFGSIKMMGTQAVLVPRKISKSKEA
jgi:hypothetical protein